MNSANTSITSYGYGPFEGPYGYGTTSPFSSSTLSSPSVLASPAAIRTVVVGAIYSAIGLVTPFLQSVQATVREYGAMVPPEITFKTIELIVMAVLVWLVIYCIFNAPCPRPGRINTTNDRTTSATAVRHHKHFDYRVEAHCTVAGVTRRRVEDLQRGHVVVVCRNHRVFGKIFGNFNAPPVIVVMMDDKFRVTNASDQTMTMRVFAAGTHRRTNTLFTLHPGDSRKVNTSSSHRVEIVDGSVTPQRAAFDYHVVISRVEPGVNADVVDDGDSVSETPQRSSPIRLVKREAPAVPAPRDVRVKVATSTILGARVSPVKRPRSDEESIGTTSEDDVARPPTKRPTVAPVARPVQSTVRKPDDALPKPKTLSSLLNIPVKAPAKVAPVKSVPKDEDSCSESWSDDEEDESEDEVLPPITKKPSVPVVKTLTAKKV